MSSSPRRRHNRDFGIHVDTSCLSDSMGDEEDAASLAHGDEVDASILDDDADADTTGADHHRESTNSRGPSGTGSRSGRDGDSSSQQDEDVFSDKSPRSSLGSCDDRDNEDEEGEEEEDEDHRSESGKTRQTEDSNSIATTRTPRMSDISSYPIYEKEDFIPSSRHAPRPPFYTPSEVRAMQMSSPVPSHGSSPRSTKRNFPSVSRLGSPSGSTQYSPKNRTPSRFKPKTAAPLVLLHATLLPLRWMWGDVINNMEASELSDDTKRLREAWRMLQDRMGDTVVERGILLGHPQNDYEVLEERLLEALELPMRRRARILECGHYLGPANEDTLVEESESEDESARNQSIPTSQRHWCKTCQHDIRYDALGAGKIFRVKVYASNGLMKAGAWAACWAEMERIDVELEPVVEPTVQEELVRLASSLQDEQLGPQRQQIDIISELSRHADRRSHRSASRHSDMLRAHLDGPSTRPHSSATRRSAIDEERLHESFRNSPEPGRRSDPGDESIPQPGNFTQPPHPDPYTPPHSAPSSSPPPPDQTPRAPADARSHPDSSDSLFNLLLRSAGVIVSDRKNLVIITLSMFVLLMGVRMAPRKLDFDPDLYDIRRAPQMQQVSPDVPEAAVVQQQAPQQYQPVPAERQIPEPEYQPQQAQQQQQAQQPEDQAQKQEQQAPEQQPIVEEKELQHEPVVSPQDDSAASSEPTCNSATPEPQPTPLPCERPASDLALLQAMTPPSSQETQTVIQKQLVRIVETITETETELHRVRVTATATSTETILPTETPGEFAEAEAPVTDDEELENVEIEMEMEASLENEIEEQDGKTVDEMVDEEAEPAQPGLDVDWDALLEATPES